MKSFKLIIVGLLLSTQAHAEDIGIQISELNKLTQEGVVKHYAEERKLTITKDAVELYEILSVKRNFLEVSASAPNPDPDSIPYYCEVTLKRANDASEYKVTDVFCSQYD